MIHTVSFEKTTYAELPHKFEAGTPDIAGAIGLGAAVEYMLEIGPDQIGQHEQRFAAVSLGCINGYAAESDTTGRQSNVHCLKAAAFSQMAF